MLDRVAAGELPKKHHIALHSASGELRYEECITRDGFDGPYTIAYHLRRPHTALQCEAKATFALPAASRDLPLRRRHYKTSELGQGTSLLASRTPLVFNRDVVVGVARGSVEDPVYFSNGDGDDLHYVFKGGGTLRTVYGDVRYAERDYVFVPPPAGLLFR